MGRPASAGPTNLLAKGVSVSEYSLDVVGDSTVIDPERDREQEAAADYAAYVVRGTHGHIGRRLGERYGTFGPTAGEMHPDHADFARACRDAVARAYPALVEEIDGQAQASGRSVEDALWHYSLGVGAPLAETGGPGGAAETTPANCSSVGVMTADGPVIARNYDFFYFETWRHLVTTQPQGALGHTGMWPGLLGGRYDGVNAAGVWVSIHGGGCRPPAKPAPGIAFHHLCRIALETCTTARQAVDLLRSAPHIASYNYFVADAHEMYVVEAHPEKTAVRTADNGVLVCTNHPMHADLAAMTETPILENSRRRAEFLQRGAAEGLSVAEPGDGQPTAVAAWLKRLMRDHSVPVCGHVDGLATFWSAVCVPRRRLLEYSLGAPCRNGYEAASWPDDVPSHASGPANA